ncbi:MAG: site-specific integrase [Pseudomonadota bacterium]
MPTTTTARIGTANVNALQPGQTLRDTDIKGFGVRRRTDAPSYFLQTRIKGRLRWITIGRHGSPWTAASARKEALRLLAEIHAGHDPAQSKANNRNGLTFAHMAEAFLSEHGPTLKPRTRTEYKRLTHSVLIPAFGRRLARDLSISDVAGFHSKLAKKPRTANFALAVMSKMMNWAEAHGIRERNTNPCSSIKHFREVARQRYLRTEELQRLGVTLDHLEASEHESPFVIAAVRLLLLTGARLNEILTLEWRYVDLERGLLLLPDSKTGQKTIYLNAAAINVLHQLPRVVGNPYVIVGKKVGAHLINLQKPWRRIRSLAELPDVRIHDLRHSFASLAAEQGASLPLIGKLLGHNSPQTTHRYAHLVDDAANELNESVGDHLTALMAAKKLS